MTNTSDSESRTVDTEHSDDFIVKVGKRNIDIRTTDPLLVEACPTWKSFLARTFKGDHELIEFVRRAAGYSLTGSVREQCMFFCCGSPLTGKDTLLTTIREVASSENGSAVANTVEAVAADIRLMRGPSERTGRELARVAGARLLTFQDQAPSLISSSQLKALTGGDTVEAWAPYNDPYTFRFTAKLWVSTTAAPTFDDNKSPSVWRRVRVIPFESPLSSDEINQQFQAKLREEYPGILAWMLRGARNWYVGGLNCSDAVTRATDACRQLRPRDDRRWPLGTRG